MFKRYTHKPFLCQRDNITFWFDARHEGLITKDGSDFVSRIDSLVGSNYFEQTTGSAQPLHLSTGYNGYSCLDFTPNDRMVSNLNGPDTSISGITIIMLITTQTGDVFLSQESGAGSNGFVFKHDNGGKFRVNIPITTVIDSSTSLTNGTDYILAARCKDGDNKIYIDNTQEGSNSENVKDAQGSYVLASNASQVAGFLDGKIAAFIIWDTFLTVDELTYVHNHFRQEFGTT